MTKREYSSEAKTLFIVIQHRRIRKSSYSKQPDVLSNIRNEKEGEDVRYHQGDIGYGMKRKLK